MKLTASLLRRIIAEETAKFGKMRDLESVAKDTEEVDADDYADSLENKINYAKALKIEQNRLRTRLNRIAETRIKLINSISRNILYKGGYHARKR